MPNSLLLAVDAGNTNTNFAVFENGKPLAKWRIHTVHHRTADEYAVILFQLLQHEQIKPTQIKNIIIASVVPQIMIALGKLCQNFLKVKPLIVGENVKLPIKAKIDNPEEVGADRVVNAVAAHKLYKKPAIIIDFGTATTFDVVDKSGNYCGGVIAPGINLSLSALQEAASKLPMVWIKKPARVVGKSTKTAMQSGIYWGYIGLIEGLVERIKKEIGGSPLVIATGGLAPMFAENTKVIQKVEPDLTLIGLNEIFHYGKKK